MDKIKYMWDFSDNRSQITEYYRTGGKSERRGKNEESIIQVLIVYKMRVDLGLCCSWYGYHNHA